MVRVSETDSQICVTRDKSKVSMGNIKAAPTILPLGDRSLPRVTAKGDKGGDSS
jgi:hypothetical protein